MKVLLDTNVLSEARKGARAHPALIAWLQRADVDQAFTSALVLGEIRRGIESARKADGAKADLLERWLADLVTDFAGRILPVDAAVADRWGAMNAERSRPVADTLIAATAIVHDLVLVTRNVRDMRDTGVKLLNPFEP